MIIPGFFCFFIGVTFNSVHYNDDVYTQNIGGTIFAFNHQDIRIWAMSGESCSFMYIVYVSLCLQEGKLDNANNIFVLNFWLMMR